MRPHAFHLRAIEEGEIDVLLTFNDYNLLRQSAAEELLPAAAEKDIGVLNGWSILRGLLTGTPIEKLVPKERITPGSDAERAERIRRWCQEKGIPMIQLALQFCLREERIHGNPIGNSRIEDIETNVRAVLEPLPDEIFEEFRAQGF
ncbi:MAG: hypothetical protein KatS3mg115_2228 [Candidatus Poribacteria bacterium]|nr:MAG: hypothetical protein KatS3mg115_2228 [Candidatus Poribacteria bacterium]